MSSNIISKENLDAYLNALAKAYRKRAGRSAPPAEIILVGGAAVLAGFGFRDSTMDVDAIINATSAMKEAANQVSDELGLPNGWLNDHFKRTDSYSPGLEEHSRPYKTFFHDTLRVRTISDENLIAMKLRSGRRYKNDLSDVIGILAERKAKGAPVTLEAIESAVVALYGGWSDFREYAKPFIENMLERDDLESAYASTRSSEIESKDMLLDFEKDYPHVTNTSNIDDILNSLKAKRNSPPETRRDEKTEEPDSPSDKRNDAEPEAVPGPKPVKPAKAKSPRKPARPFPSIPEHIGKVPDLPKRGPAKTSSKNLETPDIPQENPTGQPEKNDENDSPEKP